MTVASLRRRVLLLAALVVLVAGAARAQSDPLPVVSLRAGTVDTLLLPDLVVRASYDSVVVRSTPAMHAWYLPGSGEIVVNTVDVAEGWDVLPVRIGGTPYDLPVRIRRLPEHTFAFRADTSAAAPRRVQLIGPFNAWSRTATPVQPVAGPHLRAVTLALEPGVYPYKFVVDGAEMLDPSNPDSIPNGLGGYNSVVRVAPRHEATAYLHLLGQRRTGDRVTLSFALERAPEPQPIRPRKVVALVDDQRVPRGDVAIDGQRIDVTVDALPGETLVRVGVTQRGLASNLQAVRLVDGRPAGAPGTPFTWHDAVLYSLMIDRFADGDPSNNAPVDHPELDPRFDYQGGDLQGIVDRIEDGYFDALGVNVLWLSPVYQNPLEAYREYPEPHRPLTGYHGYWPIDHHAVDTRFGDLDLLRGLVDAAHGTDAKVMFDFVGNHVHEAHPLYAEHPEWFGTVELPDGRKNIRLWDEQRLTTWFDTFMPSFDYQRSPEALDAMTDNAVWWLKETGADAYRHDAVKHIPNAFWRLATRKLHEEIEQPRGARVYQVGETYGSYDLIGSYVRPGQLDGQFNFNLYDAALRTFLDPDASFAGLDEELRATHDAFGVDHLMGNLMDNHDKVRFVAYADGDVPYGQSDGRAEAWAETPPVVDDPQTYREAELYLAYLLTIPGLPTLYAGDEIGESGAADPDNRRMMRFGDELSADEQAMLAATQRLVHLRRDHPALRYGDFLPLHVGQDTYAYLRSDLNERVLVVLNKRGTAQTVDVEVPALYGAASATDALGDAVVPVEAGTLAVEVPALGYRVLVLE